MQIVIDIPEQLVSRIKYLEPHGDTLLDKLLRSVQRGTILPKGHGRLVDADELKSDNPRHMDVDVPYVTEVTVEEIIGFAPTIIEADK